MQLTPCQKAINLVIETYAPNLKHETIEANYSYSKSYLEMRSIQYVYQNRLKALLVGLFHGGYDFRLDVGPLFHHMSPDFSFNRFGGRKEVVLVVDDPVSREAAANWYGQSQQLSNLRHELSKFFHDVGPEAFFAAFPEVPNPAEAIKEWHDAMAALEHEYVQSIHSMLREASKIGAGDHDHD